MQLERRISKLETAAGAHDGPRVEVIFRSIVTPGKLDEPWLDYAAILGTEFRNIRRGEDESEERFVFRVHALKVAGKPPEELNDDELEAVYSSLNNEADACKNDEKVL